MIKKFSLLLSLFVIFLHLNNYKINEEIKDNICINDQKIIDIECEIKLGIFRKTVDGLMFFKKNNFRILMYNGSEKRLDAGCNEKYFWYWSKKESIDTLFYSDISNVCLVLKPCYDPIWMFEVFKNINKIGEEYNLIKNNEIISTATILKNNQIKYHFIKENLTIIIKIKNASNQNLDESVFIMPKNFKILNKMIPKNQ